MRDISRLANRAMAAAKTCGGRVFASGIERKLALGAFWTILGTAWSRGSMLLAAFLLARVLGRNDYGKYGAVDSTIGMFIVFANMGLAVSTTKLLAQYRISDRAKAGRILALTNFIAKMRRVMMLPTITHKKNKSTATPARCRPPW